MQVLLDTKSELGALSSKREFAIDTRPAYETLAKGYSDLAKKKDGVRAARARNTLLAKWYRLRVAPGQAIQIQAGTQVAEGKFPGPGKVSATVKWYPGRDSLRLTADVTDAYFSTDAPKDAPWEASCLEVMVAPSGTGMDVNQIILVPEGADGKARVKWGKAGAARKVAATWRRTSKGYAIEARIPWGTLDGYYRGWSYLPVQLAVNSKTPNGRVQMMLTHNGGSWSPETYAALKAK